MKLSNQQSLRVAIALAGTAGIIAIIWGLSVRDARYEPTFAITPHAVVEVAMAPSVTFHAEAIQEAMEFWNSAAGCRLFRGGAGGLTVVGLRDEPCGSNRLSRDGKEGRYVECDSGERFVQIGNVVEYARAVQVLEHELGHAMGHLQHDDRGSLMDETASGPLTDKDRAAARRLCE